MKTLLVSAIATVISITVYSQKQFEGTIIYNLHAAEDKPGSDAELHISFGKNAVKIKFKEKDHFEKGETLIRIDSGKIYSLNTDNKTFTSKKLKESDGKTVQIPSKEIAGYKTNGFKTQGATAIGSMAALFRFRDVVCYTSDSLVYNVPEKYASNAEFAFLYEGKIILGAEMKSSAWSFGEEDEEDMDVKETKRAITIQAISVKWELFKEDDLSIPAGYAKHQNNFHSDSTYVTDSIAMMMSDTTAMPVETKPVKKPPTNKKPPTKPKTSKTPPAARKPE